MLENKFNEIKSKLEPKTKYAFLKTDDNRLAKNILEQLTRLYDVEKKKIIEKIKVEDQSHPQNQRTIGDKKIHADDRKEILAEQKKQEEIIRAKQQKEKEEQERKLQEEKKEFVEKHAALMSESELFSKKLSYYSQKLKALILSAENIPEMKAFIENASEKKVSVDTLLKVNTQSFNFSDNQDINTIKNNITSLEEHKENLLSHANKTEDFFETEKPNLITILDKKMKEIDEDDKKHQEKIKKLTSEGEDKKYRNNLINNAINDANNKFNATREDAKQHFSNLVTAAKSKIAEDTKTFLERLPLIGAVVLFFTSEDHEKRQKNDPLTGILSGFSSKINALNSSLLQSNNIGGLKKLEENLHHIDLEFKKYENSLFKVEPNIKNEFESSIQSLSIAIALKYTKVNSQDENEEKLEEISKNLSLTKDSLKNNLVIKKNIENINATIKDNIKLSEQYNIHAATSA